jgi:hypothetical protein
MNARVLAVLVPLCLLHAGAARAQVLGPTPVAVPGQGPNGFGAPGQVAIASDFVIAFSHTADANTSALTLGPALDYFIAPNLSVGGQVQISYAKAGSASTTTIGVGPRVGYDIPLGPMFSLFAKLGVALDHYSLDPGAGPTSSVTLFSLFIDAPFLFHPVPHFFIGLGPNLFVNLAGGNSAQRDVTFGLASTVGGWFDW